MKTKGTKEWAETNVNYCVGCKNGCNYCYARFNANRWNQKKWDDWTEIKLKNEWLGKKFRKRKGIQMLSSSHDIFEENLELAKYVICGLLKAKNQVLIVTKPRFKVIEELMKHLLVHIKLKDLQERLNWRITVSFMDSRIGDYWEPGASKFLERFQTIKYLAEKHQKISISMEPTLDSIKKTIIMIQLLAPFVNEIWIGVLNKSYDLKHLWNERETQLYSPELLIKLVQEIHKLDPQIQCKIRYKDTFITQLNKRG